MLSKAIIMRLKIEGIDDAIIGLDPKVFSEVFTVTANERMRSSLTKSFTKVKKRFNVGIAKTGKDMWSVVRKSDKAKSSRAGTFRLWRAPKGGGEGKIVVSGVPVNASQFDTNPGAYRAPTGEMRKKRVRVKIRGRRGVTLKSTSSRSVFRTTVKHGHQGIFIRVKGTDKLFEERVITPTYMFDNDDVDFDAVASKDWAENSAKRFMHNLSRRQRGFW